MRIFVDSSVILAFLAGQDDRVYKIIEDVENHFMAGYINPIVTDEVIYGYLRLITKLSSNRIRYLMSKRDRKLIKFIKTEVEPVLRLFVSLPLVAEPSEIVAAIEEYGLMPADSIIALTCKHYEISIIATLDKDFARIKWLRIIP